MPIRRSAPVLAIFLLVNLPAGAAEKASENQALHLLNRLALGPTVEDLRHLEAIGPDRYIDEQLHPQAFREPPELIQRLAALDTLRLDPINLFQLYGPWRPFRGAATTAELRTAVILGSPDFMRH